MQKFAKHNKGIAIADIFFGAVTVGAGLVQLADTLMNPEQTQAQIAYRETKKEQEKVQEMLLKAKKAKHDKEIENLQRLVHDGELTLKQARYQVIMNDYLAPLINIVSGIAFMVGGVLRLQL